MPPKTKTIAELRNELAARETEVAALRKERGAILARLAAIDKQIARLSGKARRGRKPGPKRGKKAKVAKKAVKKTAKKAVNKAPRARKRATGRPLGEYLVDVLKAAGSPLRIKDIAPAVAKAGYQSASKDFYGIVATALRENKAIQKVSRGIYKLK